MSQHGYDQAAERGGLAAMVRLHQAPGLPRAKRMAGWSMGTAAAVLFTCAVLADIIPVPRAASIHALVGFYVGELL
jgi:hypothetical protein